MNSKTFKILPMLLALLATSCSGSGLSFNGDNGNKFSDSAVTEDEIKDYVRANMAKHKVPRYVRFVDSFPMNAAGKILKFKMREQAIDMLGLRHASNIKTA